MPIGQQINQFFENVKQYSKNVVKKVIGWFPGGAIGATVSFINGMILFCGGGLLHTGVVAGMGLTLSIAFLVLGCSKQFQKNFMYFLGCTGWYIDVAATVGLTILGFGLGPTMGIIAMFMGMNISGGLSFIRWHNELTGNTLEGRKLRGESVYAIV